MVPPAADAVAPALDAALRGIRGMMAEQREPAADAGALTLDAALRGMMAEQQRELRSIVTEQRAALAEHRAIVTEQRAALEQRERSIVTEQRAALAEHRAIVNEHRAALTEQVAALAELWASNDKQQAAFAAQSVDVGDALAELRASNDKQQAVFAAQKADVGELAFTLRGTLRAVVDGLSGFGTRQQELQHTNGHVMTMLESLSKLAGHMTRVLTDAEKLNDMQLKSLEQVMENETEESEMGQPETGREMNE